MLKQLKHFSGFPLQAKKEERKNEFAVFFRLNE